VATPLFPWAHWLSGELHRLGDCRMRYFPCRQNNC
jgi:hypothetical protein